MITLLHVADVHLTSNENERTYSLGVLEEIIARAQTSKADAVIIAGDLFDTFEDLLALRESVTAICAPYEGQLFFVPGNHEDLKKRGRDLQAVDLNPLMVLDRTPFDFRQISIAGEQIELLTVPHQGEGIFVDIQQVPPKSAPVRLAIAHGSVQGLTYSGPETKENGVAIDAETFVRLAVDYVALGHIHSARHRFEGTTELRYAGSARVWRRGESGPRQGVTLKIENGKVQTETFDIIAAGQYRLVEVVIGPQGDLEPIEQANWTANDFIELRLAGVTESESGLKKIIDHLRSWLAPIVRRLDIDDSQVLLIDGIANQPLAQKFLTRWQQRHLDFIARGASSESMRTLLTARQVGLSEIKAALEQHR